MNVLSVMMDVLMEEGGDVLWRCALVMCCECGCAVVMCCEDVLW